MRKSDERALADRTPSVIVDASNETPHIGSYVAMWLWVGWFFTLPMLGISLPLLYAYCFPAFQIMGGLILASLVYPTARRFQPAWGWAMGRWIMRSAVSYFSARVVYEDAAALSAHDNVIYALEPHDILPIGIFTLSSAVVEAVDVSKPRRGGMASILFYLPFVKHVYTWCDAVPADRSTLTECLNDRQSIMICPGGVKEVAYIAQQDPRKDCVLYLRARLGMLNLAVRTQTPIVPYFCFGQRDVFDFFIPKGSLWKSLGRSSGFYPLIYFGLWGDT